MGLFALRIRRWGPQYIFQGGFQRNGRETGVPKSVACCFGHVLQPNAHASTWFFFTTPNLSLNHHLSSHTHLHPVIPPWIIPIPLSKFNALTLWTGSLHPPSSSINVAFHIYKLMPSLYLVPAASKETMLLLTKTLKYSRTIICHYFCKQKVDNLDHNVGIR